VVTIDEAVVVSSLRAPELDWRSTGANHTRWGIASASTRAMVASKAVSLAKRLGLGFSSQDWVVDQRDEPFFLEANPNGQWLFLNPDSVSTITSSILSSVSRRMEAAQ